MLTTLKIFACSSCNDFIFLYNTNLCKRALYIICRIKNMFEYCCCYSCYFSKSNTTKVKLYVYSSMTLVSIGADFCPFRFSPHDPAERKLEDERIKIAGRDPVPPPLISVFSFRDHVFLTCYFSNFYLVRRWAKWRNGTNQPP
jgi:hypothetical protein